MTHQHAVHMNHRSLYSAFGGKPTNVIYIVISLKKSFQESNLRVVNILGMETLVSNSQNSLQIQKNLGKY